MVRDRGREEKSKRVRYTTAVGSTFPSDNPFFLNMSIMLQRACAIHALEAAPLARGTFGRVIEEEDAPLIFTLVQSVALCLGEQMERRECNRQENSSLLVIAGTIHRDHLLP